MKFKVKQNYRSSMSLPGGEQKELIFICGQDVDIDDPLVAAFVEKDSPGTLESSSKTGKEWLAGLENRQMVDGDAARAAEEAKAEGK